MFFIVEVQKLEIFVISKVSGSFEVIKTIIFVSFFLADCVCVEHIWITEVHLDLNVPVMCHSFCLVTFFFWL